jgi:hypothetical protein
MESGGATRRDHGRVSDRERRACAATRWAGWLTGVLPRPLFSPRLRRRSRTPDHDVPGLTGADRHR